MPIPGLGAIPPGGGQPPAMLRPPMPAPGGTGPAMAPGAQPGAAQDGMAKVHSALKMLMEALPHLPMGSDEQTVVMKATADLTKHFGKMADGPQAGAQQAAGMARQGMVNPNEAMLAKLMPGAGGGAPPPAMGMAA